MSTPQVIVSMKHIHQRLASFLRFIQLSGITSRKLCTALFRRLVLSLRFLLSRFQILCEKQSTRRVSFSSLLGLKKPRIDEESGSAIIADGAIVRYNDTSREHATLLQMRSTLLLQNIFHDMKRGEQC